ncbi:hypothetical protein FF125_01865 [Aureibaculum algae]|uniref:Lipoprotein n=1 Tax=Aureibaculum algae TaxID=2584122 RepID=A0A5B7TQP3_9FLAO|nr:hypothetical protein [Aureibaculum algae]QCX37247.1 hypothetical protein FF125_01865 [Aureibaculum algae]
MKYFKLLKLKFKVTITLFLAVSMLLISCDEKKPHQADVIPSKDMLAHIIKPEKAVTIYQNYEKERIDILKDTLRAIYNDDNFNDTRRVWFDLKMLKNYIAYVEKKSAENNISPEGLQFYFSVYGSDEGKQKNHQTFFIAPTTKNEGVQSGYTLETVDDKTQPLFLKTILSNRKYKATQSQQVEKAGFFSITVADEDGLLLNDGETSPPMENN